MLPEHTSYPFFEANQVLTQDNLNQLRDFLDEQTRLSRTNLLGIGIVCGLDYTVEADGAAIHIHKGVGITSAGHLIAACADSGRLEYYKPYTAPDNVLYPPFYADGAAGQQQYPLWELDTDHNDDPEAEPLTLDFLSGRNMPAGSEDEKVLLLFLECLAVDNKNCSPNSCDDKGQVIETTVRRLLIRRSDLDLIQEQVMALGQPAEEYFGLTGIADLRNSLPELKMRRFDVEASTLIYSADVLDAFQTALNPTFVNRVAVALSDLYQAFRPVLVKDFDANPFAGLPAQWAYLHNGGIVGQNRHLWMQYFYDHLFDVIQAYNEFRERGLEVIGLCCPDDRLFPRHLMLGIALPGVNNADYRHHFAPSPLFSKYLGAFSDLILLFRRILGLIQMLQLPSLSTQTGVDIAIPGDLIREVGDLALETGDFIRGVGEITRETGNTFLAAPRRLNIAPVKITPSKLGAFPLSKKAIPYYYAHQPLPLYQYWDPQKTRQQKAHLNLGYRSPLWNTTDDFVLNPLRYDHEEENFYRIEGHIGYSYIAVLQSLIVLRNRNRLPFDIVALKTGRNSGNISVPEDVVACNFHDLEAIYDTLKEELLCRICESVQYFYDTVIRNADGGPIVEQPAAQRVPVLNLLRNCAPNYRYREGTVGAAYERVLPQLNALAYPDLNPNSPNPIAGTIQVILLFFGNDNVSLPGAYIYHVVFIYYLVKLSETLSADLATLNFDDFANKYQDLNAIANQVDDLLIAQLGDNNPEIPSQIQVDWDEVQDQLTNLLIACKLEPVQALHAEYRRRLQEIRDRYLLSFFARSHPGIQHKAGVPAGGTFIIVYHDIDQSQDAPIRTGNFTFRGRILSDGEVLPGVSVLIKGTATGAIPDSAGNFSISTTFLPVTLVISGIGFRTVEYMVNDAKFVIIDIADITPARPDDRYPNLVRGQVIADFYLPYLCCSDCQPITFQLPPTPLTFVWAQIGCTEIDPANNARTGKIRITPAGGAPPYQYSTDQGTTWADLADEPVPVFDQSALLLRDAAGVVTDPQVVALKEPLTYDLGGPQCSDDGSTYTLEVFINGGTPPYSLAINDFTAIVEAGKTGMITLKSGEGGKLIIRDSNEPPCETIAAIEPFECPRTECLLPCGGITLQADQLLWMQPPTPINESPYDYVETQLAVESFQVSGVVEPGGQTITKNFTKKELVSLTAILNPAGERIGAGNFEGIWQPRIKQANDFIQGILARSFGDDKGIILNWALDMKTLPGFAVLKVETYDCFAYQCVITTGYLVLNGQMGYQRRTAYNNKEAQITNTTTLRGREVERAEVSVPAMNLVKRDRCQDGAPVVEVFCQQRLTRPKLQPEAINREFAAVKVSAPASATTIYLELLYGLRPVFNGLAGETKLPPNYPAANVYARALIVTKETCASSSAETFPFAN